MPELGSDNVLAAACVRIYLHRSPQGRVVSTLAQVLAENGFPQPSVEDAYRVLWERYAKRFPDRSRALISTQPPPLPLPDGVMGEVDEDTYDHAQRSLAANPVDSVKALEGLLFDSSGVLRAKLARHLGLHLCHGRGVAKNSEAGVDLLIEAALRADTDSAKLLMLAYLSAEPRSTVAAAFYVVPEDADFGLPPRPELAAACAKLLDRVQDSPRIRSVLRTLSDQAVEVPKTKPEAYVTLWRHYLLRRRGERR